MAEWVERSLAEVVELRRGFDLPKAKRHAGDVPVLSAGCSIGTHNLAAVKGPGFAVGRATNLGVPTWSESDFWPLNTTLYAANCKGNLPKFLFYLFELLDLTGYDSGSVQPMLNRNYIAGVRVKIPDVGTQQSIVDVVDALDKKIAVNMRIANIAFECASSIASSVLKRLATAGRERVPMRFSDLGQLFDGPHATPKRGCASGPYFLNISSLRSGRLDLAESDRLSEEDFTKWTKRVTPQQNDLLFSYETRLGEAALMPGDIRACLGRRMALLRPNLDRVDPHFLLHFYLSPGFQRTISMHTIHGATVPRIGLAKMGDWEVSIPSIEDQRAIAGPLKSLHDLMLQAERESASLASTRDQLLPLLMSGRLTVKAAESLVEEVV